MPAVYSSQQKAAIQQFMNFTQVDRNSAIRTLKSYGWDAQSAVNAYYGSGVDGSGSLATTAASKAALNTLFDKYREADAQDKDIIGAEGTMTYLEDIGVHAEGLDSLATLEIIQTPAMGEMHREGFVKGWFERNCDTLDKQRAYMQSLKQDLPNNKELFTRVYKYTFFVAKAPGQKAVPLDNAGVFWEVLFTSPLSPVKWTTDSTPWLSWWTEFTNSEWKKSVNKDMWNETLKFAQLTLEDEAMSFWSEESSWPSVIDEFVEWVKEKRGDTKEEAMDEEY
ncbi:uncharacterized protein SETTUDRAFT_163315 [Exserohilum turcica Et28A]|uniref:Defective in cullin neddylation protein n=1 Tax=Exserohilum turcicum (strain 28A) TaxID=671987 RepID=R0IR22_EXST2|nr:uncharacterized protein SETTUDRAFT_163315 [Exserohilum turcica Et28A]EOA87345.1 hypothetical protein SETTUDRAFT_163315 [Exserohilum turcica Et28A]